MTHVLIVDDDDEIRSTLCWMFEDAGYTAVEAGDGEQAMTVLASLPAGSVVLFDNLMPGVDGTGFAEAILARTPPLTRLHAFVCMTASPARISDALRQLLEQLEAPVMLKPFDLDLLLRTVNDAAERAAHSGG